MALIDQFGRPLRAATRAELAREQATVTTGSVRQIGSGHPADGLEPRRLASILRAAEAGDAVSYLEMAEQMEEKDLHYFAVLGVRKRAVRALDLVVEPGDDTPVASEAADALRAVLTGSAVREQLINILDAVGKGFSVCEIMWRPSRTSVELIGLEHVDPTWFEFDRINGRHIRLRGGAGGEELRPDKFVIHMARAKSGLPIRAGLARMAAWAFMFKHFTIRDWAIFLEAYGHPLRLGKYDAAHASAEDKRTLLRAVRSIGTDMAAIIPDSMMVDIIGAPGGKADGLCETTARYWDEQISKGVLGQVATTDAIAGGHAVGKIHEQVRDDIRDADAEQLAATLARDIGGPLTRFNFGPGVAVPRVRLQSPERIDPDRLLRLMEVAGPAGLRIAKTDIYRAFSLREPEAEDEVLDFARPPMPAGPQALSQPGAPRPLPAPVRQLSMRAPDEPDRIDELIDELIADGRMQKAADGALGRLIAEIGAAATEAEIRAALERFSMATPEPGLHELLTQVVFAARLAGEGGA